MSFLTMKTFFLLPLLYTLVTTTVTNQVAIVTATSSNHYIPLTRLLVSIRHHEPNIPIIVYDLGLTAEQIEWIRYVNGVVFRTFPFRNWPPHVAVEAETYAWKPIIINEVMTRDTANVIWMDSGDQLRAPIRNAMLRYWEDYRGFYSGTSSGDLKTWTFPATLAVLNVPQDLLTTTNCNAAFLGFSLAVHEPLVKPWLKCALDVNCIAPEGSSRANHRQDQAVLSCLAALSKNQFNCVEHPGMNPLYAFHTEYSGANDGSRFDLQFNFGIPTNPDALMQFMLPHEPPFREEHYMAVLFCHAISQLEKDVRVLIATDHIAPLFVRLVSTCLGPLSSLVYLSFNAPPDLTPLQPIMQPIGFKRWNGGDFAVLTEGPGIVLEPTAVFLDLIYNDDQIVNQLRFLERQGFFNVKTKTVICWPIFSNWRDHTLLNIKKRLPGSWSFQFSPIIESLYILTAVSRK